MNELQPLLLATPLAYYPVPRSGTGASTRVVRAIFIIGIVVATTYLSLSVLSSISTYGEMQQGSWTRMSTSSILFGLCLGSTALAVASLAAAICGLARARLARLLLPLFLLGFACCNLTCYYIGMAHYLSDMIGQRDTLEKVTLVVQWVLPPVVALAYPVTALVVLLPLPPKQA